MSERYEAVLVIAPKELLHRALSQSRSNTPLEVGELAPQVLLLYPSAPRHIIDDDLMPDVACKISAQLGRALALIYDNQIGWRSAYLYRSGSCVQEYTEADELWVQLNDDGMPQMNGPVFGVQELAEDQEYDCLLSAIDLGLKAMQVDAIVSSEDLKQALCYMFRR